MHSVGKLVTAWVLTVAGLSLMAGMAYVAHADSTNDARFGGGDDSRDNAPRENRAPAGNHVGLPKKMEKPKPIPAGESIWEDVPEEKFTNEERLASRPGNFEMLVTLARFAEGISAVEMEYRELAFPFYMEMHGIKNAGTEKESRTIEELVFKTPEEFADKGWIKEDEIRESGKKMQNKNRLVNQFVEKLETLDFAPGATEISNPETLNLADRQVELFGRLRKEHTEQACLVRLTMRAEHLDSDKSKTTTVVFCMVRKAEGWRICWISPAE